MGVGFLITAWGAYSTGNLGSGLRGRGAAGLRWGGGLAWTVPVPDMEMSALAANIVSMSLTAYMSSC